MDTPPPPSPDDAPERPLVALVEASRADRCHQARREGTERSAAILAQARREARLRVHQAVQEEREYMRQAEAAARAKRDTLVRHHHLSSQGELLTRGMELLHQALEQRWGDPQQRRLWIGAVIHEALDRLGAGNWIVEHPPGWACAELESHRETMDHAGVTLVDCRVAPQLPAGLVIHREGARLDGTITGLTRDRPALEALLLAELAREPEPAPRHPDHPQGATP